MAFLIAVLGANKPDPHLWGHLDGNAFRRRHAGPPEATLSGGASRLLALVLLVDIAPVLLILYVTLRFSGVRQPFYVSQRAGRGGKPFSLINFRTFALRDGVPTANRVQRFIRHAGLDYLPALINVLRGELAFVGPHAVTMEKYAEIARKTPQRFSVKPGLLGLAAISGSYDFTYDDLLKLEARYAQVQSFSFDLFLLGKYIVAAFRGTKYLRRRQTDARTMFISGSVSRSNVSYINVASGKVYVTKSDDQNPQDSSDRGANLDE